MKTAKCLLFSLLIIAATNPVAAGCLSDYNNALYQCDNTHCGPNFSFECAGCYADALVDYYSCVEEKITS